MQHNEQIPPTPEDIARLVAEIHSAWSPAEERKRRTISTDPYTVPYVGGVDDDEGGPEHW